MKLLIAIFACFVAITTQAKVNTETNLMDELDPFDANIEQILKDYDADYLDQTGQSALVPDFQFRLFEKSSCMRLQCTVYAHVVKAEQKLFLYINGRLDHTWDVSSGGKGHGTPDFDQHPNGRIYDAYSSKKFPGGNYKGLGNMPYAVFIERGFAIHGTTEGNFSKLGTPASHGCIRVHPENGKVFNRLVRQYGVNDTWITVE